MNTSKLSRKAIRQGLEQTPIVDILGAQVNSKLTSKQKAFAMNLAKGDTGSEALRKAYGRKGNPKTIANDAYKLRNNPDIITMQEAYSAALEGQRYQTPAALRALVIDSLVKVIIDPEANHGQVVAAAKVLGTVTEVAAFTERKEVHTISSSEDARAKVMAQLRDLMKQDATDVQAVEIEAQSLEDELRATRNIKHERIQSIFQGQDLRGLRRHQLRSTTKSRRDIQGAQILRGDRYSLRERRRTSHPQPRVNLTGAETMNTQTLLTPSEAEAIERKEDHGKQQAAAQAASLVDMVCALTCDYDRLQELRDEREELAEAVEEAAKLAAMVAALTADYDPLQKLQDEKEAQEARAALAAWDEENAEELKDLENEAGECTSQEDAQQRIQEDPLSVEGRSSWDEPNSTERGTPFEFRIVLCTGGPHGETRGELDDNGTPRRAWMQYQDWGTPMTQFYDISQSTLLTYCQEFYFGE